MLKLEFTIALCSLLIIVGCTGNNSNSQERMSGDSSMVASDDTNEFTKTDEPAVSNSNEAPIKESTDNQVTIKEPQVDDAQFRDIVYEGTATDEQTGISQDYTLLVKPDLQSASIGGGPFYPIEDQGNGTYMWLDGAIIGMSIQPMRDKCIVYGSEGAYFCTLYRR